MSFYEDLVMKTQMNYSKYYSVYAAGRTPYPWQTKSPCPTASSFSSWCSR